MRYYKLKSCSFIKRGRLVVLIQSCSFTFVCRQFIYVRSTSRIPLTLSREGEKSLLTYLLINLFTIHYSLSIIGTHLNPPSQGRKIINDKFILDSNAQIGNGEKILIHLFTYSLSHLSLPQLHPTENPLPKLGREKGLFTYLPHHSNPQKKDLVTKACPFK